MEYASSLNFATYLNLAFCFLIAGGCFNGVGVWGIKTVLKKIDCDLHTEAYLGFLYLHRLLVRGGTSLTFQTGHFNTLPIIAEWRKLA